MTPKLLYAVDGCEVWHGGCLDVLRSLPDASVDSVVTDPPYGLGREPTPAELVAIIRAWILGEAHEIKGRGFMGRSWDAFVPHPDVWRECLRVLKPGGHLVAFAGTRTQDLMGLALRLAGFEIRDCLQWIYGSGFPKSLDVSKAIDQVFHAPREMTGTQVLTGNAAQTTEEKGGTYASGTDSVGVAGKLVYLTKPATFEAQQADGWGTALKPAYEPIILARKPLDGTVAANVLAHGAGGINVDGCRIETSDVTSNGVKASTAKVGFDGGFRTTLTETHTLGRFPANVLLDEAAGALLDAQAGDRPVSSQARNGLPHASGAAGNSMFGTDGGGAERRLLPNDSGGPSRYFYCAKASRAEREAGLEHLELAPLPEDREEGGAGLNSPRAGTGRRGGRRNVHPTVKPVALMRWLARLVTPVGGVVCEPFAGSGTTLIAAQLEGFRVVGAEREAEYLPIIQARVAWWAEHPDGVPDEEEEEPEEVSSVRRQLSLFEAAPIGASTPGE